MLQPRSRCVMQMLPALLMVVATGAGAASAVADLAMLRKAVSPPSRALVEFTSVAETTATGGDAAFREGFSGRREQRATLAWTEDGDVVHTNRLFLPDGRRILGVVTIIGDQLVEYRDHVPAPVWLSGSAERAASRADVFLRTAGAYPLMRPEALGGKSLWESAAGSDDLRSERSGAGKLTLRWSERSTRARITVDLAEAGGDVELVSFEAAWISGEPPQETRHTEQLTIQEWWRQDGRRMPRRLVGRQVVSLADGRRLVHDLSFELESVALAPNLTQLADEAGRLIPDGTGVQREPISGIREEWQGGTAVLVSTGSTVAALDAAVEEGAGAVRLQAVAALAGLLVLGVVVFWLYRRRSAMEAHGGGD